MDPVSCHAEMKMSCHMAENSVPTTTAIKSVLQILARCKLITVGYEKKKTKKQQPKTKNQTTFRGENNIWAGTKLLHLWSKKALSSHQLLCSPNNVLEPGKGEIILGSHSFGDASSVFSATSMMCQQKLQSLQLKFTHNKQQLHASASATFRT